MALALDEFGGAAAGPDLLPDTPHPVAGGGVTGEEVLPGRDETPGVAAQFEHVDEADAAGVRGECRPQHLDLGGVGGDQDGFVVGQSVLDERQGAVQERVVPGVQVRPVSEGGCGGPSGRVHLLPAVGWGPESVARSGRVVGPRVPALGHEYPGGGRAERAGTR